MKGLLKKTEEFIRETGLYAISYQGHKFENLISERKPLVDMNP